MTRQGFMFFVTKLPPLITRTCLTHIDKGESFVLDCLLDRLFQVCELGIDRMGRKCTSCMLRELYWIKWESRIPTWSRLRDCTDGGCRTRLPSRECVVLIIKHYIRDIHIATARVDEVPHTDTITITISSDRYDCERWIDHLHSGSKWKRTTMKGLCCISIDILARLSAASYS
jgi:hypothetical protein